METPGGDAGITLTFTKDVKTPSSIGGLGTYRNLNQRSINLSLEPSEDLAVYIAGTKGACHAAYD